MQFEDDFDELLLFEEAFDKVFGCGKLALLEV